MTAQQRRDVAFGRKALADVLPTKPAAPAPVVVEPAAPAAVTPVPAAVEPVAAPAAAPAETADPEGSDPENTGGKTPSRFRFTDAQDQAIALLAKSKGISLAEAVRIYNADTPTAPAAPATTPTPVAPQADSRLTAYDKQIADTKKKVEELTASRTKHRDDAAFDKVDEINDQLADLRSDLRLLEHERTGYERNREQQQAASFQRAADASAMRVYEQFPVLAQDESTERLALDAYILRQQANPSRDAIFASPTWPEVIAKEFAEKHGLKLGTAPAAGTPPAAAAPVSPTPPATLPKAQPRQVTPASGARLITSAGGTPPSTPGALTVAQAKDRLRTDPDFRREVVRNLNSAGKK